MAVACAGGILLLLLLLLLPLGQNNHSLLMCYQKHAVQYSVPDVDSLSSPQLSEVSAGALLFIHSHALRVRDFHSIIATAVS